MWVGETGWPTAGANFEGALPGTKSLKNYYTSVACWLWAKPDTSGFWFTAFDAPTVSPEVEKHFGIADSKRKLKFALPC